MKSARCTCARGGFLSNWPKPQDPENGYLSVNDLDGQESELFCIYFKKRNESWARSKIIFKGDCEQRTTKPEKLVKIVMMCVWWNSQGIVHYKNLKAARRLRAIYTVISMSGLVHDKARLHVSIITRRARLESVTLRAKQPWHSAIWL